METIIVSIVCIALIFVGGMTMSRNYLASVDITSQQLQHVMARDQDILRTNISAVGASVSGGNVVSATFHNAGQIKLADFEHWDVILEYEDNTGASHVNWLPYTAGAPGNNEWTVSEIDIGGQPGGSELFDIGILDPGEDIVIRAKVSPGIGPYTNVQMVVSTPNGVSTLLQFTRA